MPDIGIQRDRIGYTMCGDLLCGRKKCARWVGGSFVANAVTLMEEDRRGHMCWARHNGVRLLGGKFKYLSRSSDGQGWVDNQGYLKGRFSSSSK